MNVITPTKKTPKHLKTAIKVAEANDQYPKWRLGGVMMKGGSLQAIGMNKLHTSPQIASDEHLDALSTHAEEDTLKRCGNPKGTVLYLARVGRNGKPAMARPCKDCEAMLRNSRVKKVIYTIGPHEFGTLYL